MEHEKRSIEEVDGEILDAPGLNEDDNDTNITDDNTIIVPVQLPKLKDLPPMKIKIDKNSNMMQFIQKLQEFTKIQDDILKFTKDSSVPRSYPISVGDKDIFDFENNIFTISHKSKFLQFWNDWLDEAKIYERNKLREEKKNDDDQDQEMSEYTEIPSVKLIKDDTALQVGEVEVSFERTLRIPDDGTEYPLPPSLGSFDIVKVQDYEDSEGMPMQWKKRKGVIVPMWQKGIVRKF